MLTVVEQKNKGYVKEKPCIKLKLGKSKNLCRTAITQTIYLITNFKD